MLNVSNTALVMALACLLIKGLPQETKNIFTWKFTVECEEIRERDIEPRIMNDFFLILAEKIFFWFIFIMFTLKGPFGFFSYSDQKF